MTTPLLVGYVVLGLLFLWMFLEGCIDRSRTKYRILHNGCAYKIEERCFYPWWSRVMTSGYEYDREVVFYTLDDAREWVDMLKSLNRNRPPSKPYVVIEQEVE